MYSREDYLDSETLEKLTAESLARRDSLKQGEIARFWAVAFGVDCLDFQTLEPLRVRAAWRLTREVVGECGLLARDESLRTLEGRFFEPNRPPVHQKGWPKALLPLNPKNLTKSSDIRAFCKRNRTIARTLAIHLGAIEDREGGSVGLSGLLEEALVQRAWPDPIAIVAFEQYLVNEALDLLVERSVLKMRKTLWQKYGLAPREVDVVLALARVEAVELTEASLDERRSLMELRLNQIVCADEVGTKNRLNAMKQLAGIQGLGRSEPENASRLFVDVVADFSKQKPIEITAERVKAIPAEIRDIMPPAAEGDR